jgi:hypothetical protein
MPGDWASEQLWSWPPVGMCQAQQDACPPSIPTLQPSWGATSAHCSTVNTIQQLLCQRRTAPQMWGPTAAIHVAPYIHAATVCSYRSPACMDASGPDCTVDLSRSATRSIRGTVPLCCGGLSRAMCAHGVCSVSLCMHGMGLMCHTCSQASESGCIVHDTGHQQLSSSGMSSCAAQSSQHASMACVGSLWHPVTQTLHCE